MQIRVHLREDGKIDITYMPSRPGEQRTMRVHGVSLDYVKEAIETGVNRMRADTKFVVYHEE